MLMLHGLQTVGHEALGLFQPVAQTQCRRRRQLRLRIIEATFGQLGAIAATSDGQGLRGQGAARAGTTRVGGQWIVGVAHVASIANGACETGMAT